VAELVAELVVELVVELGAVLVILRICRDHLDQEVALSTHSHQVVPSPRTFSLKLWLPTPNSGHGKWMLSITIGLKVTMETLTT